MAKLKVTVAIINPDRRKDSQGEESYCYFELNVVTRKKKEMTRETNLISLMFIFLKFEFIFTFIYFLKGSNEILI